MRVLVTVSPRIYRQAVAFSLKSSRPDIEVRAAPPKDAELELAGFRPHLLVHNDIHGLGSEAMGSVLCRVEVSYSDGMDARVRTGENVSQVPDMSTEDLLRTVDVTATVGGVHQTEFLANATGAYGDSRGRYAPPTPTLCEAGCPATLSNR